MTLMRIMSVSKQNELCERILEGEAMKQHGIRDLDDRNEFIMFLLYIPIFFGIKSLKNTCIYAHKIQKTLLD